MLDGRASSAIRNVHWLGQRPYEEIPRWGSGFDVALMPWLDNDWIRNCNPIKMKEYLALGLRVVSTDFPEVRRYADVIRVAGKGDDFVALVRRALAADDAAPEARRARVADASWAAKAQQMLGWVDDARKGGRECAESPA